MHFDWFLLPDFLFICDVCLDFATESLHSAKRPNADQIFKWHIWCEYYSLPQINKGFYDFDFLPPVFKCTSADYMLLNHTNLSARTL